MTHDYKKQPRIYPTDISFLIADLKWNNGILKILELGEGPQSYFQGFDELFGIGIIWKKFWNYLAQHNHTIWYIGNKPHTSEKQQFAWDHFLSIGGKWAQHLNDIDTNTGIIVFSNHGYPNWYAEKLAQFKKTHHNFLIINDASTPHVNHKYQTNLLFDDDILRLHKPRWKLCKKQYCPQYIQKILQYLNCDHIVIKPLNAANGWGTIIIHSSELDPTLKKILTNTHKLKNDPDRSWNYWAEDGHENFLIEECVFSQPINIHNNDFDGTMRVVFILNCDNNSINLTYLGSCWKLPKIPLGLPGSLMEHHKSGYGAVKTNVQDQRHVKKILNILLPQLYKKMLI